MSFKTPSVVQNGLWKTKFMCLSCGKMFGKEQQVKIHLNVHYGDNIYNCRFCEKIFANYATFEVNFDNFDDFDAFDDFNDFDDFDV